MEPDFLPFSRASIGDEEIAEVVETLRSGWLTTGPRVQRFQEAFAAYVGAKHAVALSSGTAALHLGLLGAGVGPGDEVITSAYTFASCVHVIEQSGATPRLVDISPDDYNLDPEQVEHAVGPRTRAVMPVHFAGQPCRMDAILDLARTHGLAVVEDAAHAVGARYRGRLVGSLGDATAFSFYANKNMTTGEGGMLTTDGDDVAERARVLSLHGMSRDAWKRYTSAGSWYYEIVASGFKYNMTDIEAALGIHQLRRLPALLDARARVARMYGERLRDVDALVLPAVRPEVAHAWHLYVVQVVPERLRIDRARFIDLLRERGIGASVHFIPVHYHPYFRDRLGYAPGDFPNAEALYERAVSLPLFPGMTEADVERVACAVEDIVREHGR